MAKSMKLGYGGRATKLKSELERGGKSAKYAGAIVGKIAREKQAAPGQKNYHGKSVSSKGYTGGKRK